MEKIGFIGLGHMGNPMVKNLLKAGYHVKVFDVMPAAIEALLADGATPATSVADATHGVDVIITMLQTGLQVSSICLGADGIFTQTKENVLYIDCSSIEINMTQELHKAADRVGVGMLDSPVSGGVAGANAATLTFMVGGAKENFERAEPILKVMGKKIVHVGPAGHGQAVKICNNLILGISMIAVSEGFALGKKLGLDMKKFFEITSNASSQCWSMTSNCPVPGLIENAPANKDYQPGFMAKMMLKDLRLSQKAAESVGAVLPLGAEATELYALFVNQGFGELDFSGIIRLLSGEKNLQK